MLKQSETMLDIGSLIISILRREEKKSDYEEGPESRFEYIEDRDKMRMFIVRLPFVNETTMVVERWKIYGENQMWSNYSLKSMSF